MGVHRKAVMHAHSSLAGNQTQLKKKALIFLLGNQKFPALAVLFYKQMGKAISQL